VLVDRGVVEPVDGTTYRIVDDSVVLRELAELNAAVGAVRAGVADERLGGIDPDERADNAGDTGSIPTGRAERPTPNRSVSNAD